jgi:hypothetical protein
MKAKYKLLPQSKKLIKEMLEAGYPFCIDKGDWSGNYPRHCNACIEMYGKQKYITAQNNTVGLTNNDTFTKLK